MVKKLLTLLFTSALVFLLTPMFAQEGSKEEEAKETPSQEKAERANKGKNEKGARWEGRVVRSSPDKNMLTVRQRGSTMERTVYYDSSTQFVSQEHGSKKVNPIQASDIKDNDRVICRGKYDDKGDFHATLVSKRLTP